MHVSLKSYMFFIITPLIVNTAIENNKNVLKFQYVTKLISFSYTSAWNQN